jgi:DNA-binding GntR family transcriptional regulator
MRPYIRLYAKLHASPEIKGHEHEHILSALRGGDAEKAERVVREHIMVNAESIAACLPAAGRAEPPRGRTLRRPPAKRPKRRSKNGR